MDWLQFFRYPVQQVAPGHAQLPYVPPPLLFSRQFTQCALTLFGSRLSRYPHDLPPYLCHRRYADSGPLDDSSRWPKDCQDDRSRLPASRRPHWCLLQLEFDLRQPDLSLPLRCLHSDAQGHHPRRRLDFRLGSGCVFAKPETVPQRLRYCRRCHHCVDGRNPLRRYWCHLPDCRCHLRGSPTYHGPETLELCRLQDGPSGFSLLLRPHLRRHERCGCADLGVPQGLHG